MVNVMGMHPAGRLPGTTTCHVPRALIQQPLYAADHGGHHLGHHRLHLLEAPLRLPREAVVVAAELAEHEQRLPEEVPALCI